MLRVVAHASSASAQKYYAEGLSKEDYYSEKQEIVGKWFGRAAEQLGLTGEVGREQFCALTENRHPVTDQRLTARNRENRRAGYDFTFSAPKSLSVLYGLTRDETILDIFRRSVADTMAELEKRAEVRVRKGGRQGTRTTGNLAWAEFVHFTARPVGGIPDPHLHIHAFAFNCSYDSVEVKWKAAELGAIKENAPYFEAAFHSRLASGLAAEGYGIQRKKGGWEIKGMPASVIDKFSRRTAQIDELARELGIKDPKKKSDLGSTSRENKRHGMSFAELQGAWSVSLTEEEKAQISKIFAEKEKQKGQRLPPKMVPGEALDFAISSLFERRSVVERDRLLAEALNFAGGQVSVSEIKAEFQSRNMIGRKIDGQHYCTTKDILAEEVALLGFVRSGRNAAAPFFGRRQKPELSAKLSAEQKLAAKHILYSKDQVIALRGAAGAGKTTLMRDVVANIQGTGKRVFAFASSASASRGTLRDNGFSNAETVARLLVDPELQRKTMGQVIWIDEAGLLGVRDMWRIMQIAGNSTRVILTGDTAQHAPVARGDALRLLQLHAGLKIATLTEIKRQERADYRKAIEALSEGDLKTGFSRLEALGAFVEIDNPFERHRTLAADYVALQRSSKGVPPLLVCPTHAEGAEVTYAIREARREAKEVGTSRTFRQYHDLEWSEAERSLPENYRAGLAVQFHQNSKKIIRGDILKVLGADEAGVVRIQDSKGLILPLPLKEAENFMVYEEREIELAVGDRIRITRNGRSENGKRLHNGNVFTLEGFNRQGGMVLDNKAVLNRDHGHIAQGYYETSFAVQSKTGRQVLVAQSSQSFLAASREQFYVSSSRGIDSIKFYTDNLRGLQEAVGNSSARLSGLELAGVGSRELSKFMSDPLHAKEWRDILREKRGIGEAKSFVEGLAHKRRVAEQKMDGMDWEGYIKMRRDLRGADGKNRSKGFPSSVGRGEEKGKTVPKISLHAESVKKQIRAADPSLKAQQPDSRMADKTEKPERKTTRVQKAFSASVSNFKKIAERAKDRVATGMEKTKEAARKIRMGKAEIPAKPHASKEQVEGHRRREKQATAEKQEQKTKAQVKSPQPVPKGRR